MGAPTPRVIDVHFHVGLLGDSWPQLGWLSPQLRGDFAYKVFLAYARIHEDDACDRVLRQATLRVLDSCGKVERVVCLALDKAHDAAGRPLDDCTHMWVSNDYVMELQRELPDRVLLGASVHPFRQDFEDEVKRCVERGAVLIKWLPSAQRIDLADERIPGRLKFLATARAGRPLPVLLHCGPEYAVPPSEERLSTLDFLSWARREELANRLRGQRRKAVPEVEQRRRNLETGLREGATVIFAHCGLPYFARGWLGRLFEHSDYKVVADFLRRYPVRECGRGSCFADVSACCTPFRRPMFRDIAALPADAVLFGSDFPTPVFELSADPAENLEDLKAVLAGRPKRVIIPEGNLVDVNFRELFLSFPGHPMFTNFSRFLL
ncbi:MAG: amidohydrolase family protein [Acidobacteriota bacterium]|jgi:predicted TIM-barrel fold metal-dependent hydrolase